MQELLGRYWWIVFVVAFGAVGLRAFLRTKRSPLAIGDREESALPEDIQFFRGEGSINGQSLFPFRAAATSRGLLFLGTGFKVMLPYGTIRAETTRSLFFTYVYLSSSMDTGMLVRISARMAAKLENASNQRFRRDA